MLNIQWHVGKLTCDCVQYSIVCMGYNRTLVTVRQPPSHIAVATTAPLFLAIVLSATERTGLKRGLYVEMEVHPRYPFSGSAR
jgi:hypothetical protein